MAIGEGDSLPAGQLQEGSPDTKVDPAEAFAKGTHIVFAVPGAFTPGCSKTHLPGYVKDYEKIKEKGVDSISCISVNDVFVMAAWGNDQKADGKVRMLADPAAAYVKALGLDVDASGVLGNVRSKRWSMIVKDGKVSVLRVEVSISVFAPAVTVIL